MFEVSFHVAMKSLRIKISITKIVIHTNYKSENNTVCYVFMAKPLTDINVIRLGGTLTVEEGHRLLFTAKINVHEQKPVYTFSS